MSNIKSLGDYPSDHNDHNPYNYAGGYNSAIGIDSGGHVVNVYADGFIVDNGPFRSIDLPENAEFLSDIKRGIAPPEFQDGSNEVSIHLIDHQNQRYNKEPPTTSSRGKPKIVSSNLEFKIGEKNTTLRIKLRADEYINLTISQDATVADLKTFISNYTNTSNDKFTLLSGFPPRNIVCDDDTTLYNADILNSTIIQQMKI